MLMSRKSVLSLLGISIMSLSLAASAVADTPEADPMAGYYGNTWQATKHEDSKYLHIDKDMSMQIKLKDDRVFDGTWTREGNRVCFYVGSDEACFDDLLNRMPGEIWTGIGIHDGQSYTGILHEGRESFPPPVRME